MVIALISGILMSVQGVWNTAVTKQTGLWVCNCFVQLTALLTGLMMWYLTEQGSFFALARVKPHYLLLGGVLGTAITYTVIRSMADLGPAKAVVTIVVAQVVTAYLISLSGLFGVEQESFDIKKLAGIAMAVGGVILVNRF